MEETKLNKEKDRIGKDLKDNFVIKEKHINKKIFKHGEKVKKHTDKILTKK